MFNKINKLSFLLKIPDITSNKIFNTNLPVLLQVLNKTNVGYLLRLGDRIIDAKSYENLIIGSKYWGVLHENNNGVLISNLIKQPKILDDIYKSPVFFDLFKLEIMSDGKSNDIGQLNSDKLRDTLIYALERVNSRDEFNMLSNMLFGLKYGVATFIIKDREKRFLTQVRKAKNKIEFCAVFSNLGIIYGEIFNDDLILRVQFELTRRILLKYAGDISLNIVNIIIDSGVKLLFDMDNILDLEA